MTTTNTIHSNYRNGRFQGRQTVCPSGFTMSQVLELIQAYGSIAVMRNDENFVSFRLGRVNSVVLYGQRMCNADGSEYWVWAAARISKRKAGDGEELWAGYVASDDAFQRVMSFVA